MIDLWKNFSNKNIISSFVWAWYSLKVLRQINGVIKTHWEVVIDANKPHNVKFSTLSFFYRWSYGIVMWEVFTIGMWNTLLRGSGSTGQQEAYYSQFSVSSYMLFSWMKEGQILFYPTNTVAYGFWVFMRPLSEIPVHINFSWIHVLSSSLLFALSSTLSLLFLPVLSL